MKKLVLKGHYGLLYTVTGNLIERFMTVSFGKFAFAMAIALPAQGYINFYQ